MTDRPVFYDIKEALATMPAADSAATHMFRTNPARARQIIDDLVRVYPDLSEAGGRRVLTSIFVHGRNVQEALRDDRFTIEI